MSSLTQLPFPSHRISHHSLASTLTPPPLPFWAVRTRDRSRYLLGSIRSGNVTKLSHLSGYYAMLCYACIGCRALLYFMVIAAVIADLCDPTHISLHLYLPQSNIYSYLSYTFPLYHLPHSFLIHFSLLYLQEPLAEYCALWKSANAIEVFGFEALYLDVHPLKVRAKIPPYLPFLPPSFLPSSFTNQSGLVLSTLPFPPLAILTASISALVLIEYTFFLPCLPLSCHTLSA